MRRVVTIALLGIAAVALRTESAPAEDPATAGSTRPASPQANPAPASDASEPAHYSALKNVILSERMKAKAVEVANGYYTKTEKDIVITSGTRTPAGQAAAMFRKLKLGDDLSDYVNRQAAKEIKDAYQAGESAHQSDADIRAAMTRVIEAQVARGTFISRHLTGNAFDVRIEGLSAAEREALEAAAKASGAKVLLESKPPHLHVQFDDAKPKTGNL